MVLLIWAAKCNTLEPGPPVSPAESRWSVRRRRTRATDKIADAVNNVTVSLQTELQAWAWDMEESNHH